jgi:hypothetical protein
MFQLFYTDAAKVDQDVAYVAMVVNVCCKHLSLTFHLFPMYVASVSDVCLKCFIRRMLQVLHLEVDRDVAYVAMVFQRYILNVSSILNVCCKCFIWMLQK